MNRDCHCHDSGHYHLKRLHLFILVERRNANWILLVELGVRRKLETYSSDARSEMCEDVVFEVLTTNRVRNENLLNLIVASGLNCKPK